MNRPVESQPSGIQLVAAGTSTRAMLCVLARGGCRVAGSIDRYQDADTRDLAAWSIRVHDLDEVPRIARRMAQGNRTGVFLAGGMENRPEALRAMEADPDFCILGCSLDAIRQARDPGLVAGTLADARLPWLKVQTRLTGSRFGREWIAKPFRSAGGERVCRNALPPGADPAEFWLQEFAPGRVFGATFVGHLDGADLIGVCRHLPPATCRPFRYEGSAGPFRLPPAITECLSEMGDCVAGAFGLRGWFGVDFVVRGDRPYLIEINPRFSQSMEILDGRTVASLLASHLAALGLPALSPGLPVEAVEGRLAGKRILFNDTGADLRITAGIYRQFRQWNRARQAVCDIPQANETIPADGPVCTVHATGETMSGLAAALSDLTRRVRECCARTE